MIGDGRILYEKDKEIIFVVCMFLMFVLVGCTGDTGTMEVNDKEVEDNRAFPGGFTERRK